MTVAISVRGMSRRFGNVVAVAGIDLEVRAGEIVGLVGPDGAGKTTTMRAIAGLLDPDDGEVRVLGQAADSAAVRERVGLMPQRHSLYGDLSVSENLHFFRQLFGISKAVGGPRIARLLELTRLSAFVKRRADDLSGGMYKKLALACALLHQPRVLLLDEPTNGVDPVSRRELWTLLGEFVGEGMAVLVTTPYMDEAARCHRVGLLHEGRLLAMGAPAQMVRDFDHPVFTLRGGQRHRVLQLIESADEVRASSPAGSTLRVVVGPDGVASLSERLGALDCTLEPARPTFEDLFLTHLAVA